MKEQLKRLIMRDDGGVIVNSVEESIEGFSFDTLWNDYERRTWFYSNHMPDLDHYDSRLLNWIGSIDNSGYVRERCMQALIDHFVVGDENRILLRLQDWVPAIQLIARDWILANFKLLPADSIYANQGLILYLSRKERIGGDLGLKEIKRDLLVRACEMNTEDFFRFSPIFRRFLFLWSFRDDGCLRSRILDDPDPFNRFLLLYEVDYSEILVSEKLRLLADQSVFIRRKLVITQIDAGEIPSRDELLTLALASNRSLRELGQYYLDRFYSEDCYLIYKSEKGASFYYLADYARPEDVSYFLEGIHSGSRKTQFICLKAFIKACPERLQELDVNSLISLSGKFRSLLIPFLPQLFSANRLLELRGIFESSSVYGLISYFGVLEKKSFWLFVDEGLDVMLTCSDLNLLTIIEGKMRGKVEIFDRLTLEQYDSINHKLVRLCEVEDHSSRDLADYLCFIMRSYSS